MTTHKNEFDAIRERLDAVEKVGDLHQDALSALASANRNLLEMLGEQRAEIDDLRSRVAALEVEPVRKLDA